MTALNPDQFLGLPPAPLDAADAIIVPVPLEKTVSYGTGTWRGPRAILDASCQIEAFEEETQVDFAEAPRLHTLPLLLTAGGVRDCLAMIERSVAPLRGKFVVGLGGEHTVTYGLVKGLVEKPAQLTIVHVDAHADLADQLGGEPWAHGCVMRRLWEHGCRLIQIGIRSLSRAEYELASGDPRINTFYAYHLSERWPELLDVLGKLQGDVYLSIDLDGLDVGVISSTGTPQPDGLSWRQAMQVIRTVTAAPGCRPIGADVVELIASPHAPGCDLTAARMVQKLLAFWWRGRR